MAELRKQVRELAQHSSAGQIRHEEITNRMTLLEDEAARRRVGDLVGTPKPPAVRPVASARPAAAGDTEIDSDSEARTPGAAAAATAPSRARGGEKPVALDKNPAIVLSPGELSAPEELPSPAERPSPEGGELPLVKLQPTSDEGRSRDVVGAAEVSPAPVATARASLSTPPTTSPTLVEPVEVAPPKPLYAVGLRAFRKGEFARAKRVFAALVQRFPEHSLADNAYYWTGRACTEEKNLDGAITAYESLLRQYPTGNKVPDALLALGLVLAQRGRADEAKAKLRFLAKNFPATSAAKQAARRLREMKP